MKELIDDLERLVQNELGVELNVELTRTAEKFGDYSTNAAMKAAAKLGKDPKEVAELLAGRLHDRPGLAKVEVAGPGFINLTLADSHLWQQLDKASDFSKPLDGQEIVLEHTDPNPFKEFHIGHAYSNTIGVSIGKLLQASGAKIRQVSYHGDVGLHIAMAIYGYKNPINHKDLGKSYAFGAQAYQADDQAKAEIEKINQSIYKGDDQQISDLYREGRQKSLQEFGDIYERLNSKFEKNYFESETAARGMEIVKEHLGSTFQESEGAIIYDGEKAGLHKRVFITKQGLPTYEAKEIGLAFAKVQDYPSASSFIVITGNEIDDYFRVLLAAISEIDEALAAKIRHISHGMVKLSRGKMSSRSGEVVTLSTLEQELAKAIAKLHGEGKDSPDITLSAMKYEFLKHRIGSDFVFDISESISLQGSSGPYLQYAHARARAILQKAGGVKNTFVQDLEPGERSLARTINHFPEIVAEAAANLMPSDVATYLYGLAQQFNRFYESNRVIGDNRQSVRLHLVSKYADVLKAGLGLLNISAPDRV